MTDDTPPPSARTDYQPLYMQIKNILVRRISTSAWKPGELLPSEFDLASEYKVSQGTIRKALTAMEGERLIIRRQGRGTYVARHSTEATLFHFFRMVGPDDQRLAPVSIVLSQKRQRATCGQGLRLAVAAGSMLHAIVRVRHLQGMPAIFERIFVPVALMPQLEVEPGAEMQDEMYVIYQERFGVTVARASERLEAVAASREEACHLGVRPATPLIQISRIARDVGGRAVELRISRCCTRRSQYAAEIS